MCRNNEGIVVDHLKTVKIEIFQFFWIDCFEMFPDIFKRVLHFKLIMFRKFQ